MIAEIIPLPGKEFLKNPQNAHRPVVDHKLPLTCYTTCSGEQ
jgi:hypothetical protein